MFSPRVNIIIRTKNEENWISLCLNSIKEQDLKSFQITVVDSGSRDKSVERCKDLCKVLHYKGEYFPGKAINFGVDFNCEFQVILSAHCLPKDSRWLSKLVSSLDKERDIVAAYGRQIPTSGTGADDYRDLIYTFPVESRVQKKDPMFHNANSIIRTEELKREPFDETIKHLEDRVWAEKIIKQGKKILYNSEASVYHHHGLHQHGNIKSFRAIGVKEILQSLSKEKYFGEQFLSLNIPIIVSSLDRVPIKKANSFFNKILALNLTDKIFVASSKFAYDQLENKNKLLWVDDPGHNFIDWLHFSLTTIESRLDNFLDGLSFIDLRYKYINLNLLTASRKQAFKGSANFVCPAWSDQGNYYKFTENVGFEVINFDFKEKKDKPLFYRAIFGQGATVRSSLIRLNQGIDFVPDELVLTKSVKSIERV